MATTRTRTARPVTLTRLRARWRAILGLLDRHGLANPRVLGSVATGQTDDSSDVQTSPLIGRPVGVRVLAYSSAVADASRARANAVRTAYVSAWCVPRSFSRICNARS
jgi:hypothetical protein